ncbi:MULTISPECIES: amino acid ABC transporter permease [Turicibacter]|uniref:ABC transporter permease subunit n=3 Tax=Turicibacter sanguinis TaxID=154288 RepID=A0A9X5API1_9FIRM|nr:MULTISPECIES: amino acid ABC transporter permease [Turicibacter]EFF63206.1 ABC transporter, permease protein [Turicibacter sanguinis PC909]EGC91233.1 ABC transporter, permease protein [Turicibacter sp. HGF1]MBP3904398.1 amino acid ABC transporter permease [Turicibacter sp.]MCU7192678.1 amino acid ABC transporter permease [Turicibacter sanguinis]MCU7198291.1 amino acid ABC transporter permease [Turicibacter sanguinis]
MMFLTTQNGFLNKSFSLFVKNFDLFMYGIKMTLILAFLGTMLGLVIGLVLGGLRAITIEPRDLKSVKVLKKMMHCLIGLYVWFFRGTPMMVQAMFLYHALRPILGWSSLTAGIVIISVNTGAYMAEIIRSGIQSVDKGQLEAARSIGMTAFQSMMYIILPQAIKNAFPSIGNEFIVNIKDSSMLNVIGVIEVFFQSKSVAGSVMLYSETFFITCLIYLVLTTITAQILGWIEKKMNVKKTSFPSSQTVPMANL